MILVPESEVGLLPMRVFPRGVCSAIEEQARPPRQGFGSRLHWAVLPFRACVVPAWN